MKNSNIPTQDKFSMGLITLNEARLLIESENVVARIKHAPLARYNTKSSVATPSRLNVSSDNGTAIASAFAIVI